MRSGTRTERLPADDREVAVFKDRFSAEQALEKLRDAGMDVKEAAAFDDDARRELASPPYPEIIAGAVTFGFITMFAAAYLPNTGPLLLWGGLVVGAILGLGIGWVVGGRDPALRRRLAHLRLSQGEILVHVRCSPHELPTVREVLAHEGGRLTMEEQKVGEQTV